MSNPANSQIHIFLVQPLSKNIHNEMIVYADTEELARAAAALANKSKTASVSINEIPIDLIYLNEGMSICIEIQEDIIKIGNNLESVQVEYNEVRYDLAKDLAQKVIAEKNLLGI
jgi:hypothetical protein